MRWIEKKAFKIGLKSTRFFRKVVRRAAYSRAGGDPERVHELALESLNEHLNVIEEVSRDFDFKDLHVQVAGWYTMPFGTAPGLDKNGDALRPLSKLFGYLKPGTIIVPEREGNSRPRVAIDEKLDEIYNAQGFPSKGLEYFLEKLRQHRILGIDGPLIPSVCGLPLEENLSNAYKELENILRKIFPYVDGIEWNPFSPNTQALTALRTSSEFKRSAKLIKSLIGPKLTVVKMGPYDDNEEQKSEWLKLAEAFLDGGGDGLTAVNTYKVPKEKIPSENWGYQSAGRSGTFLQDYRQRALKDARTNFPNAFIFATGGIDSAEQAWNALQYADALEGYTPYTFKGFGLILEMAEGIRGKLKENGYKTLREFLASRKF
jgi:dihydroorotate dehydrogenase